MGLTDYIRRIVAEMPDEAAVTFPVVWLRQQLEVEGPDGVEIDDLTCERAAEALDRSASTVRDWCRAGNILGAYRLKGREWRIPKSALREFLDSQEHPPPKTTRPHAEADLSAWRRKR